MTHQSNDATICRAASELLARQNFHFFVRGAFAELHPETLSGANYVEAMCFKLERLARNRERRLLLTLPPRHLKSFCCSVALPAWMMGHNPDLQIMVASYGEELAKDLATQFRDLVNTEFYRTVFPGLRLRSRNSPLERIRTTGQGYRRYVTPQGPATGLGADVIIVDDILKVVDAHSVTRREDACRYLEETLLSRINNKRTGRVIVTQQRLHEEDLPGRLIDKGGYHHVSFPARAERDVSHPLYRGRFYERKIGDLLDPDREPEETLDEICEDMGPRAYRAQYQQNPTPSDSDLIRLDRLHLVDELPDLPWFTMRVQSWDTAVVLGPNSSFSVCMTFGRHEAERRWYLLDIVRARYEYPELKQRALELKRRWQVDRVLVENENNGRSMLQQFRQDRTSGFEAVRPWGSKEERFIAQTDFIQSDRLAIPRDKSWFDPFIRELMSFPEARHDDQVDALAQFCKWIRRKESNLDNINPKTGRRRRIRTRPRERR